MFTKTFFLVSRSSFCSRNWNSNHRYSTRFKKTVTANVAALENALDNENNHFSLNGLSALLAEQDAIHSNDDGTFNLLHPVAFPAANGDTLHYGQTKGS